MPSTPMAHSTLTKIAHVAEKTHHVKRKGVDYMFNVPNYPMCLISNNVANLRKEVNSQVRLDNFKKHDMSKETNFRNKRGSKFVQNVTFNEFWGQKKTKGDRD